MSFIWDNKIRNNKLCSHKQSWKLVYIYSGQVQSADNSCEGAGFISCCFSNNCQLASGCSCDHQCYTRDDCCTDIRNTCTGGYENNISHWGWL